MGLINLLYGAYSVLGTWDLNAIFIKPDLSNYGYTFSQALFDFDNFIGEFWGNVVFSLVTAAFLLIYTSKPSEDPDQNVKMEHVITKRVKILAILTFGFLFFGILGSIFRWGLARPYLDGQTFTLLFENFDIYHTSEQFFLWVLALTGFPAILYLTVKSIRTQEFDWHPNRIGLIFYGITLAIMELFWIIFPIELLYMIDANAILGLIYSILQWFVIIGIIGILGKQNQG